MPGQAF